MGNIVLLDELTINKIAAGEVIERPASVIKEMVENSIDAGATNITVEIKNGGISYIKVTDNGKGIAQDDLEIAFERHATSKIRSADDLDTVTSMGFRGEALASIAAISNVELISKTESQQIGYRVVVEAGNVLEKEETGCRTGTTITVRNLFFNTPVRYKFLKKDYTESGYIEDVITRIALVNPNIAIKLINTGKTVIQTNGSGDLKSVIYSIYGKDVANSIIDVDYILDDIHISGVIGRPEIARSNRANQIFFINKRYVKDKILTSAVEKAYKEMIPMGKFAFVVLNIDMNPSKVDVNVHPAKMEVRFEDENMMFKAIYHAIKENLTKNEVNSFEKFENDFLENKQAENNQITKSFDNKFSYDNKKQINNYNINIETNNKTRTETNTITNALKATDNEISINKNNANVIENETSITENRANQIEDEAKVIENETILKSQEVLRQLQEMKEKMIRENLNISQEIKGEQILSQTEQKENQEEVIPSQTEQKESQVELIPSQTEQKESQVKSIPSQTEQKENQEEQISSQTEQKENQEEQIPSQTVQIEYQTEQSKNKNKFELQENNQFAIDKQPQNQSGKDKQQEKKNETQLKNQNILNEESNDYKSTEYSPEFEDMYLKMFGTKPIKETIEKKEEQENQKETLDDIIDTPETVSIFDGNPETLKIDYKYIGIAFGKYAIFEIKNEVYFLDIYQAQERILYESIKSSMNNKNNANSQLLLIPDVITLSHKEMEIVKDNSETFKKIGFIYDEFGENTIKLTEVPEICSDLETQELFLEILNKINLIARTQKTEIEEKIIQIIAENVVKRYEVLNDKDEIETLMNRLLSLKKPFITDKGTSLAMKMTKYDIERKFARK